MRKELLVLFALASCSQNSTGPPNFDAVETPIEWKSILEQNFRQIEMCSGLKANFEKLRVYIVPVDALLPYFSAEIGGAFYAPASIYIETDDWRMELLRHEYLHYILAENNIKGSHPPFYFKERCGSLIS